MNCLFSNPRVMPFLSMHGRNYGKVVFRRTNICGLVVGKSNKFPTLWLVVEFFFKTLYLFNRICHIAYYAVNVIIAVYNSWEING